MFSTRLKWWRGRRPLLIRMLWLAVMAGLAFGQTPTDPSAQAAPAVKPATVEGVVTNDLTGAFVPRAHVSLRGFVNGNSLQYGALTADDGKFSITGIQPGTYNASVERVGFAMPPGLASRNAVRLQADQKKSDVNLKLVPTGEITGKVTNPDGDPIEGVGVNALANGGMSGTGTTDEKGEFRIGGLAPGKYRVRASSSNMQSPPEVRTDGTEDVHQAATYYPGVLSEREAALIEVRADGSSSGADIRLKRVPWVEVSGRILGKPRSTGNTYVMVESVPRQFGGGAAGAPVKPDGAFVMWRLDPGKYRLTAGWNAPGSEYVRSAPFDVEVAGSEITGIELRLVPSFSISGQLEYENDQAKLLPQPPAPANAQNRTQQAAAAQNAPQVRRAILIRDAANDQMQNGSKDVTSDESFHIDLLPANKYRLGVSWNTAYVKSMRLGPTVIEGDVVDLSNGTGDQTLTLVLSAATGSVSGSVKDDSGTVQGTRVVLVPADFPSNPGNRARFSTAKADGSYVFNNLAPGSYKIVAVSEGDTDIVAQRSGLDAYESVMDSVEVHPDEKVALDLKRRTPDNR
jgi:Carboxypeptidase regulatory-like domain